MKTDFKPIGSAVPGRVMPGGISAEARPAVRAATENPAAMEGGDWQMRGLGDVVHVAAVATGARWLVKKVVKDCGCEQRRKQWNEAGQRALQGLKRVLRTG